jgi:hypothetical protein
MHLIDTFKQKPDAKYQPNSDYGAGKDFIMDQKWPHHSIRW